MKIGEFVFKERLKLGLSQAQFAARLGLNINGATQMICNIEKNRIGFPRNRVKALCKLTNTEPNYLIEKILDSEYKDMCIILDIKPNNKISLRKNN